MRWHVLGGALLLTVAIAGPAAEPVKAKGDSDNPIWSFRPVARPALPAVRDAGWARDDLDRFILARLEAAGLKPNPDADRLTLIRRAAFDLTGLPPTGAEVESFLADRGPDDEAFARVVDRYLASPRYGERWGRHWLDVVRYADSVGRTWNAPFLYAWRYRDYVIDAFNADKPFDQFIQEQLAGDLLPAKSVGQAREQRIATGFLALGSVPLQEGSAEQFLLDRVDDQLDVTTRGFLGLSVACARCHDHKYDPVTTRDYYALAGVFYSIRTLTGQGSIARDEGSQDYVDANILVRLPRPPGAGPAPEPADHEVHSMSDYRVAVQAAGRGKPIRYTYDPDRVMGVLEGTVRDCAIRVKGVPFDTKPAPPRGDFQVPGLPPGPKVPADASGRLEVAGWIASKDNPLTARVMANRVWQHLFGRGIVRTPDDFGSTGDTPTHPELLDHLATRFVENGWSVKKLIRAVVLSRTYRLGSAGRSPAKEKNPGNELYWRANLRRLEVEPLRDSLLAAAGRLTLARPPGIPVSGVGTRDVHSVLPADAPYRAVYLPVLRSRVSELNTTFDFPDPCQVAGRREVTTVGPQALFFMNAPFVADCARQAADRVLTDPGLSDADRVRLAYRRVLSRPPGEDEVKDALGLLGALGQSSARDRWATFVQALMASAEFRYVR